MAWGGRDPNRKIFFSSLLIFLKLLKIVRRKIPTLCGTPAKTQKRPFQFSEFLYPIVESSIYLGISCFCALGLALYLISVATCGPSNSGFCKDLATCICGLEHLGADSAALAQLVGVCWHFRPLERGRKRCGVRSSQFWGTQQELWSGGEE